MAYVAFVIDAYSRRILGWRAATTMKTTLVLDALEQAVWTRHQAGIVELDGLIHHNDAGSQGSTRRPDSDVSCLFDTSTAVCVCSPSRSPPDA